MDDSFAFLTNPFSMDKYIRRNIQNILSKALILGMLALGTYSSTSLADYNIWYDSETFQEHQIYNGNTLLVPPSWACGRKFSNPSYYRHQDNYYNTLDSADFWKDIYVWIPKPGCPYTSESVVEYVDGSQSFPPTPGAITIEISTNYGSQWVDENGSWPQCVNCTGPSDFAIENHNWGAVFTAVAALKTAIIETDLVKFNSAAASAERLLTSLEKNMDSRIQEADLTRRKNEKYRLASVEGNALNQLSMARKQLEMCVHLASNTQASDSAYPYCDLMLENLQYSKSLWQSRN